jgi:hypothetical protein
MSALVHHCEVCTHNQLEHARDDSCSYGGCAAGRHTPDFGPSVLIPTFDIDGRTVDLIFQPGQKIHQWGEMCACDECQETYAVLVPS